MLLTAVSLNVVLAIQLGEARRDSRRAELRQHVANVDEYVPAYIAEALDGQRIDVGRPASGHRQVIIAYRSTCGHCNAAVPGWRELAQKLSSYSTVELVALAADSIPDAVEFATMHKLQFPSIAVTDGRWQSLYRLGVVPQTMIVDANGRIVYARVGGFSAGSASIDSVVAAAVASQ